MRGGWTKRAGGVFLMISPARRICYKLLCQIESRRLFSDDAINSESMQKLERRDRNLTTEIIYGCLRWQALLDHVLAKASSRSWDEVHPGARILLRMSLYQMWRMDRIPDHALVNDAVELAKSELGRGIHQYINGILRSLTRTRVWEKDGLGLNAPPWTKASIPQWLWDRWVGRFREDAANQYALFLNEPPQIALRSPEGLPDLPFLTPSDLVPGAYIQTHRDSDAIENHPNDLQHQDEASQLIPHLLGPTEGWTIWDCCAAPGGKSAILSLKCCQSGRLTASDLQNKRIRLLAKALKTTSICNSDILVADASFSPPFSCRFDAVLADVPCSGLGTLRRNPEIKWNFTQEEFARLQQTQKKILESASKAVRVGGLLLYSTCSTEPEENEDVIRSFLSAHPQFSLQKPCYPKGIEEWTGPDNMVRTFPSSRLWDGLFAGLMVRTDS
jgi:16S rRNA (cytosine967-C5)-methyltransferase